MARFLQNPSLKAARSSTGRGSSVSGSRHPAATKGGRLRRILCCLLLVLPPIVLLSYSSRTLVRIRARHAKQQAASASRAGNQCLGWRHTLSCSPYGCEPLFTALAHNDRAVGAATALWTSVGDPANERPQQKARGRGVTSAGCAGCRARNPATRPSRATPGTASAAGDGPPAGTPADREQYPIRPCNAGQLLTAERGAGWCAAFTRHSPAAPPVQL